MKYFLYLIFCFLTAGVLAQAPTITSVEPLTTYPNGKVVISGSGFSSTPANLQVWFDGVQGTITASSDYAIEVTVPAQARLANVEVINLTTDLSAKARLKFMPSFSGTAFDASKFAAPLSFTATTQLWDLCVCDMDADGKPDIAASKFFTPSTNVMILKNNSTPGNLVFASSDITLPFPSDNVVCGDLDGNGKPDLVVARGEPSRNEVRIFENASTVGNISFNLLGPLVLTLGDIATRITIRDLNNDGKPDLVVTNSANDQFYIFENQSTPGNISFKSPTKLSIKTTELTALTTYEAEVQDFNGDGFADIVINQFQARDLFILKNLGTATISYGTPQKISINGTFNRMSTADFNRDGKLDLLVTNTFSDMTLLLMNQSTTSVFSFAVPISLTAPSTSRPWGVDVSDMDGDSDPDIIVANRDLNQLNVYTHSGNMTSPTFTRHNITTVNPLRNIKTGDLDGDGKPDIAFTAFDAANSEYSVEILRNANCHKPKILNTAPLTICAGQTIRLNAIPANNVTFSWKDATNTQIGTGTFVDITTAGTYTVTATGEGGACVVVSDPITVTSGTGSVPADPTIGANSPACSDGSLMLTTNTVAGATYSWTGPNNFTSTQEDPTITNVTSAHAGIYTLQVSIGTCRSNVATRRVDVVNMSDFSITASKATTICQTDNTLTLSVNNLPGHTFQWKRNGANLGGETASTLAIDDAVKDGSYTVVVQNAFCSKESAAVVVTALDPPTVAYQLDATACTQELVQFTNQSTTDPGATPVFDWDFGDGGDAATPSPTHTYATAQTFSTSLSINYSGITGCTANTSKNITITNGTQPVINTTAPSICPEGGAVTLSVAGSFTSITWSNTATGASTSVSAPGTYSVTTVDGNSCTGTDEIVITAKPAPALVVTATPSVITAGSASQLKAEGADTYSWTPIESLDNPLVDQPKATPAITTTYTVVGTNADGCTATAQIDVKVGEGLIPLAFSPNGDGENELWIINGSEARPECTISIFDGRGRRIHEQKGSVAWDGSYEGKIVPAGTYYYVYSCPNEKPATGSILVIK